MPEEGNFLSLVSIHLRFFFIEVPTLKSIAKYVGVCETIRHRVKRRIDMKEISVTKYHYKYLARYRA